MINLTPERFLCSIGACPAVFKREDGMVVIVGKRDLKTTAELVNEDRVAVDEDVICIPQELLENLVKKQD